jgi:hypothetical protein
VINFPEHLRDNPWLIGSRNIPSQEDLLTLLRGAEVLVSYDLEAPILADAARCGCPVRLVLEDGSLMEWNAPE